VNQTLAQTAAFAAQVEQLFVIEQPETFFRAEAAFRVLANDTFSRANINAALRQLLGSPLEKGDWTANQLVLHRGPGYALSITLLEQQTRFIHTSPHYAMYAPLGGSCLAYELFRLPPSYRNAVFDPTLQLLPSGTGSVECGQVLCTRPDHDLHDFKIDQPQLVLKFTSSAWHVLEWLFDRVSLKAVQANDAALATTQLRVASYLLGRLGHASSIEPLKKLASHRIPNIRWAGIQNLGRLSGAEALEQLRIAVNDEHPHIQSAARKSLAIAAAAIPTESGG